MSQNKIYTKEEKELIVKEYLAGNVSLQMLTEKYNLSSRKTLYSWVKKYKENGTIYSINKNIDYKTRYEILKKYHAFLNQQQKKK